jgi:multiple sugar transport system permease protein
MSMKQQIQSTAHTPVLSKSLKGQMLKQKVVPYLFIAPHLLLFIIFFAIPAVVGIYISFTKWNIYTPPKWVGFRNYYEILFNHDSTYYMQLRNGLGNTLRFVLMSVPFCVIVPLFIAIALNTKTLGNKVFQSLFYLPNLLSISTVVLTWVFMFHRRLGPINNVFKIDINWFGTQPFTWTAIIIITVWWCIGGNLVIYLAALAGIRQDLYESASIDGANAVHKFFSITLPGLKHPLAYTLVLTTIAQFNIYGQPLMFSKGGPKATTHVMMMYIRELAFGSGQSIAGLASAMSVMLGLCILAVSTFQFILMRNND